MCTIPELAGASKPYTNGDHLTPIPTYQLSFPIPTSPDTCINLHITNRANSLVVFIAATTTGAPLSTASLSSLVYALPGTSGNRPLSTPLYQRPTSIDFTTRLAKVLARRLQKPVYVGGEVTFFALEDEAAGLRGAVDVVLNTVSGKGG